jgi:hypothetical protein
VIVLNGILYRVHVSSARILVTTLLILLLLGKGLESWARYITYGAGAISLAGIFITAIVNAYGELMKKRSRQ